MGRGTFIDETFNGDVSFNKRTFPKVTTVTPSAGIAVIDPALGNVFEISTSAALTLDVNTTNNPSVLMTIEVYVKNTHATVPVTITLNADFATQTQPGTPSDVAAGGAKENILAFKFRPSSGKWLFVAESVA